VLPRIARERVPTGATRCENASKWAGVSAFFSHCTIELSHIFNKQAYLSISNALVLVGTADLLGNGFPELIWRNQNTGEVRAWRLGGNVVIENLSLGFPPLNWQIVGFGDFTGAGRQDILWRNTVDGSVNACIMNGFTIVGQWLPGAVSLDWRIRATPDVNGNHVNSILWSNVTTGQQAIWTSNGSTFVPAGPFATAPPAWLVQPALSQM